MMHTNPIATYNVRSNTPENPPSNYCQRKARLWPRWRAGPSVNSTGRVCGDPQTPAKHGGGARFSGKLRCCGREGPLREEPK